MIEITRDMWYYHARGVPIVITTNGTINAKGECVMGRGCAREAAQRYHRLPSELATLLRLNGNEVFHFPQYNLYTLPVKWNWYEKADPQLILRGCTTLSRRAFEQCVMPRPGCGNGHLRWEEVRPMLAHLLDDRFIVCHKENV